MKKFILCLLLLSPFLVCDPQGDPGIAYYKVIGLPDNISATNIPVDSTGQFGFKLDLANLPCGTYTVAAQACSSMWGCSEYSSPFEFSRPKLLSPVNVKMEK